MTANLDGVQSIDASWFTELLFGVVCVLVCRCKLWKCPPTMPTPQQQSGTMQVAWAMAWDCMGLYGTALDFDIIRPWRGVRRLFKFKILSMAKRWCEFRECHLFGRTKHWPYDLFVPFVPIFCWCSLVTSNQIWIWIRHLAFYGVWPLAFGIWPLAFGIWHWAFGIWHSAFGIWHWALGIGHLAFDIGHWAVVLAFCQVCYVGFLR